METAHFRMLASVHYATQNYDMEPLAGSTRSSWGLSHFPHQDF